ETCTGAHVISRIRANDRQAEAELVERYNRGVMIIIRRGVGNPAVAEDICQETFRIVIEKIRRGDVREPKKLSGFICGVARNQVLDHFRRAARYESAIEIEEAAQLPHPAP